MSFYFVQFLTGLASASSLFLVASGLSIIFGVTRVVNFAHGAFSMLGAFVAYSAVRALPEGPLGFWGGVALAALAVGVVGVVVETLVLRRIYRAPELYPLVATFGVVLIVEDATLWLWGPADLLGPRAPGLAGAVDVFGTPIPEYELVLIAVGATVLGALWLLFHRTRWGTLVRAATQDRDMLGALGVNQALLFTGVFFLGSFLAGLGGALQVPRATVSHHMDMAVIAAVFVVVVVGGMGSITGAFLAAVLIAELNAFGILVFPKVTLVLMFLVMAVVLVARPHGLLGRPEAEAPSHPPPEGETLSRPPGQGVRLALAVLVAALAALPWVASEFALVLAIEVLVLSLFAASLHFIMGNGGLTSFGHAAYFGAGAYAAALAVARAHAPMELAIALAPLAAGLAALAFGWFCARLSGVYMAMLSLAFAQIVWSAVVQFNEITGGEDGIVGIWPPEWAGERWVFYYLVLAIAAGGVAALWRLMYAPFGYALRGARDSRLRAEAIGIDVFRHRWLAFAVAGLFAGLAGALHVFAKGGAFPTDVDIPRSIHVLMMVLLGGVATLVGPLVGAAAFVGLEDQVSRFDFWRATLGVLIIVICVVAPRGIAGSLAPAARGR